MSNLIISTEQNNLINSPSDWQDITSLKSWMKLYYQHIVIGQAEGTIEAKTRDLSNFLDFFIQNMPMSTDHIDRWTPSITMFYQKELMKEYKPKTAYRIMGTLRHFARWVEGKRFFLAGSPFINVKQIFLESPAWNGLKEKELYLLKSACETREAVCKRKNQDPIRDSAIFYTLLNTGLRVSELCNIKYKQYHHKGFHDVMRKGSKVSKKISVPKESRDYIDKYLSFSRRSNSEYLFLNVKNTRQITRIDVSNICIKLSQIASAHLNEEERFKLTPHMLRHTFLKKIADKHGVHIAQQMSGNISFKEIFNYAKPSQDEIDNIAEEAFA